MKKRQLYVTLLPMVLLVALCAFAETDGLRAEFGFLEERKGPEAMEVVDAPTIFRVAELNGLPCDAATFEFLLDRPEASMILARKVDPSVDDYEFKLLEDGSFIVDDHKGLTGQMELLVSEPGRRYYFMTGEYDLFWGMNFTGRLVLVPEYAERPSEGGGVLTDASARSYFKVESAVVGMMARMVVYVFPSKVDSRIKRFSRAVTMVTEAVADDPDGMYSALAESGRLDETELAEFRAFFGVKDDGGGADG